MRATMRATVDPALPRATTGDSHADGLDTTPADDETYTA